MSIKKEYRISSEDSARPAATINSEPHYYAQGLKPEVNVEQSTEIGINDEGNVVRRTVYNTGVIRETRLEPSEYPNAKPFTKTTAKKAAKE